MSDPQDLSARRARLTPAQRALLQQRLQGQAPASAGASISRRDPAAPAPLSAAQRGLWLTWQLAPDSPAYNLAGTMRLRGALDVAALQASLGAVVARHEILRTVIVPGAEPVQQVLAAHRLALEPADFTPDALTAFVQLPFALDREPACRARLFRVAPDEHLLALSLHHIAGDGWSLRILVDEVLAGYAGTAPSPLPIQFADYAVWERKHLDGGEQARQLDYWRAQLGSAEVPQPLVTLPRGAGGHGPEARYRFTWDGPLCAELRTLARAQGTSMFVLVVALLDVVLHRVGGQDVVRIGTPVANRQKAETHGLIGYLLNLLVLQARIGPADTFRNVLARVHETMLGAQAHQDLPFDALVRALQPERQPGVHPLFQVKCTQQDDIPATRAVGDLAVEVEAVSAGLAHFDLSLDFTDRGERIGCVFAYDAALFDTATIEALARAMTACAGAVCRDAAVAVSSIPLAASPTVGEPVVHAHTDVLSMWDAAVAQQPDAIAVRHESAALTFAEVDAAANCLAGKLVAYGVGREQAVAVHAHRSPQLVVGMLAVLKAGGVHVSLDPALPAQRLAYQLQDSGAVLLLDAAGLSWQPEVPVWPMDAQAAEPGGFIPAPIAPAQAAYLIYTSGSTGQPKGVLVSHGALANYVQGVLERVALPDDAGGMAMISTVAADLGHTVLFGALCSGRTLHLIDAARAFDPDRFAGYMREHRVDVLKIVPGHLQALLAAADPAGVLPARCLVLGGEATGWPLLERIAQLRPDLRVLNHYGPTETTVGMLTQSAGEASRAAASLPVGRTLDNCAAWVLDASLQPVPPGVAGELYLSGAGVARGYRGRAGQTAERFVAHPFAAGERMYRTGDRVRELADGSLEFLGRADDQVKIRGYRVEPREVARVLQTLEGVGEAEVIARAVGDDRLQLLGYVVPQAGMQLDPDALRTALGASLPDYMVPSAVTVLDALPRTANGKLDRRALPDPRPAATPGFDAPQGEAEQALAEVWAQVLRRERVGRHDNFFQLGGDSILALQIIARARKRGLRLTPRQLMEKQTVAAVAAIAGAAAAAPQAAAANGAAFAPTPVQAWFFAQEFASAQHWNQSLLLSPGKPVDVERLRQAVGRLVGHHEALRLQFTQEGGRWCQQVGPQAAVFETVDLSAEPDFAAAVTRTAAQAQLKLTLAAPFRAVWMEAGAGRAGRLLLVAHHLVVDAVSWRILVEDLQACYTQAGNALPPTSAFRLWSETLARHAQSPTLLAELPYWQAVTQHVEPLPGHAGGSNRVAEAQTVTLELDAAATAGLLSKVPAAYRTRINDVLLTALARTLCAWDGRDSVLVELEGHGREDAFDGVDMGRTVGWFTTLFPVRLAPAGAALGDSLKAVKEQLRAVPGNGLGYGVLRYLSETGRVLEQGAAPQVTFNYLGQIDPAAEGGWQLAPESSGAQRAPDSQRRTWLEVVAVVQQGRLGMRWTYSTAIHDEATVTGLAARFMQELRALIVLCSGGAHGATPSDFPLAALSQAQLDALPLPLAHVADLYPLSPMQQGMLFHSLYAPADGAYVNQLRADVDGLDVERFRAAWAGAIARHDVLRTGFVPGDAALQWVATRADVPLTVLDWQDRADAADALDAYAQADAQRGFDLATPPLMRLTLVRTAPRTHHLIWTRHHLLLDGWSTSRLLGEVLRSLAGESLPAPVARYRDYIGWVQGRQAGAAQAWWRAQLATLDGPTQLAGPTREGSGHGEIALQLDAAETERLTAFARAERVTVNTLVQAAWALLLGAHTRRDTVAFGATVSGRPAELAGAEQMVGLFINTLPVVATVTPGRALGDWLRALQAQGVAAREHEHTPLHEIQGWAGHGGRGLFDTIVVFENYPVDAALRETAGDGPVFRAVASREPTSYAMTLAVLQDDALSLHLGYARASFDDEAAARIGHQLAYLLRQMPDAATCALRLADAGECDALRRHGENPWQRPYYDAVHQRIAAQRPEAPALIHAGGTLCHGELNVRANRLAHRLRALGVRAECRVGVVAGHTPDTLVAMLAILKAGGACVPLDPALPAARLEYMLRDSGIALLLGPAAALEDLPANVVPLALDRLDLSVEPDVDPGVPVHPDQLAYVIYTSGSTGQPKGVAVAHGPMSMHLQAAGERYPIVADDRVLLFASLGFDAAFEQWALPLMHGAAVVLRGNADPTPEMLAELVRAHGVTMLDLPPALIRTLEGVTVRTLIAGGEAWPLAEAERARETLRPQRLFNAYGPTECVVSPTIWHGAVPLADDVPYAPIGTPLGERKAYVVDAAMQLVPAGVPGELYLGGTGLARGYLQRAGQSAERFVADPFDAAGGRLYRTGDLVRWRADGQLEYLGRIDQQIKIRGLRIEPGEIEAQLLAQPGVRAAAVVAVVGDNGTRLVAYACGEAEPVALREGLARVLPDYMVPTAIVMLEALPLTTNGKLDRAALPAAPAGHAAYEAPQGETETTLASLWAGLLDAPRVGRHDHFFELGGHSLLAMQLAGRIRAALHAELSLREIFAHPALAAMAAAVAQRQHGVAVEQAITNLDEFIDDLEAI
ncbi:non-ribosomal peptide synthetase [Cupriavidus numazuensis]|uniref:Linear gramicidin synthase subunit D n=1 Tax=Cupriavidus numazuensis TaxID=221992 RepID=A0ABM8TVU7_9BURK|nr:non-ribosomal peptide synthetase [Cupriavidus numazuensis]CAG2160773.1 Linear gramicidin synthase subunit D [Cupriavidus numazuensis]